MSAFVVSREHIQFLVVAGFQMPGQHWHMSWYWEAIGGRRDMETRLYIEFDVLVIGRVRHWPAIKAYDLGGE